jgi:MFS family permease
MVARTHVKRKGAVSTLVEADLFTTFSETLGLTALFVLAGILTNNALLVAGVMIAQRAPSFLSLVSGIWFDRGAVKRLYVYSALAGGAAFLAFAVALGVNGKAFWSLYALAFVIGAVQMLLSTAYPVMVRRSAGKSELGGIYSRLSIAELVAESVGGGVAGFLYVVSRSLPFAVASIAMLAGVPIILLSRQDFEAKTDATVHLREDLAEGFRWLRGHAQIMDLYILSPVVSFFLLSSSAVYVLFAFNIAHLSPGLYGISGAFFGLGGAAGSWVAPHVSRVLRRWSLALSLFLASVGYFIAIGSPTFYGPSLFEFLSGVGLLSLGVNLRTITRSAIPQELQGRVGSVSYSLGATGGLLGAFFGGGLAERVGLIGTFWVAGAGIAIAGVIVLWSAKKILGISEGDQFSPSSNYTPTLG